MHAYVMLAIAIFAEIIGTTALKFSDGFTRLLPSLCVAVGYGAAFYFLSLTLRTLPISLAYAIWSGVGVVAIKIIGVVVFKEQLTVTMGVGTTLVVIGIVILHAAQGQSST
jgi:small multidrug resistance pump